MDHPGRSHEPARGKPRSSLLCLRHAASIDAVYIRNQQAAHDAALALHRAYATGGDTPGLKAAASEIVPVIEKHIAELQKLAQAEPDDAG